MTKPRLYDLYCGAGGCTKGYQRAGFYVVGVDLYNQKNYCGDEFIQMNALEFLERYLDGEYPEADAFGASPPCQVHTDLATIWRARGDDYDKKHVDLIPQTRQLLRATGRPYIIENVPGAPLINPVVLTGPMFGLMTIRERLFECSFDVPFFLMSPPGARTGKLGIKPKYGEYITVAGHFSDVEYARKAMGIDWMTRDELAQAIPPSYTQYLGERLLETMAVAA